jgi:hypothetical protein
VSGRDCTSRGRFTSGGVLRLTLARWDDEGTSAAEDRTLYSNSASSAFASFKSPVSKPSVNQS